jgi:ribonuclease P protein component
MADRPDQGLARHQRLTRSSQFREAYDAGEKQVGRLMVVYLHRGDGASLRLGVVASRKVGNAVCRARARRLMREAYRRNRQFLQGDVDVVLVARPHLLSAEWSAVVEELRALLKRAGLLHEG